MDISLLFKIIQIIALTWVIVKLWPDVITPLRRNKHSAVADEIRLAIAELGRAVEQHVQVNAVLALSKQFENSPDLMCYLAGYSDQVVGASLLHRANCLASAIKHHEDRLERLHKHPSNADIVVTERTLETLYRKLKLTNDEAQKYARLRFMT